MNWWDRREPFHCDSPHLHKEADYVQLLVCVESPYKILGSGSGQDSTLQHQSQHLIEKTVHIFEAPETDRQLLHTAIESAGLGKSSRYQLVLLDSTGHSHRKMVSFDPKTERMCMLTIERSDAVLPQDALDVRCSCAHALVSANAPFRFESVDSAFAATFGYAQEDLVGRRMSLLHGQSTDGLRWATLLQSACEGRADSACLALGTSCGVERRAMLSCTPVAAAPNGAITHVLVHCLSKSRSAPDTGAVDRPPVCDGHKHIFSADDSNDNAVRICPRRKAARSGSWSRRGGRDGSEAAIVMTAARVRALAALPLRRAAEELGVSETALKAACRRLGLPAWPRRGIHALCMQTQHAAAAAPNPAAIPDKDPPPPATAVESPGRKSMAGPIGSCEGKGADGGDQSCGDGSFSTSGAQAYAFSSASTPISVSTVASSYYSDEHDVPDPRRLLDAAPDEQEQRCFSG